MYYAFTIKKNKGPTDTVDEDSYREVWALFEKHKIKLKHLNGELDSRLRLHYHAVAVIPKGFYRRKLCLKTFSTNLIPLKSKGDIDRWIHYCYKDCPPEDRPDLCEDAPLKVKLGLKAKLAKGNIFRCCNENTVTIKT